MNKKGQVYIFVAVLLLAFAFTVARPPTPSQPRSDVFEELHKNFDRESPIVVNNAIYSKANVTQAYIDYADSYFDYARTRSPKFRFLYLLKDNGALLIGNELGLSVNVSTSSDSYNLTDSSKLTIAPQNVTVDLEGLRYGFSFNSETYQVKSLFRQKNEEGRRVFVND